MKLIEINEQHFLRVLQTNDNGGGNKVNESLLKLFKCLSDQSSVYEVSIKVAALNQLYSTAIQFIEPVVEKIVEEYPVSCDLTVDEWVKLVDNTRKVEWVSKRTDKPHKRNNLSFSSKYVHFLSKYEVPIYDSYVWLVMVGYLNQKGLSEYSFTKTPKTYAEFYDVFKIFKEKFQLERVIANSLGEEKNLPDNYYIDKYLWQYGKELVDSTMANEDVSLDTAKRRLAKSMKISVG
ncbi:MAG: extracellular solute-binding protein [Mariprofundaceae bacterium]|nr:extracellular solute-binding protein [Mariprofundaceae bacterium]